MSALCTCRENFRYKLAHEATWHTAFLPQSDSLVVGIHCGACKAAPVLEKKTFWFHLSLSSPHWNFLAAADTDGKNSSTSLGGTSNPKQSLQPTKKLLRIFHRMNAPSESPSEGETQSVRCRCNMRAALAKTRLEIFSKTSSSKVWSPKKSKGRPHIIGWVPPHSSPLLMKLIPMGYDGKSQEGYFVGRQPPCILRNCSFSFP